MTPACRTTGGPPAIRSRIVAVVAAVVIGAAALTACSGSTSKGTRTLDAVKVPDVLKVASPAFKNGGPLSRANSCDGTGTAPTITWGGVPPTTKSVAVVVDDPDAVGGDFLQWLVVGLPPAAGSVPTHEANANELDNTGGTRGYAAPCPPIGTVHHYDFTVYALNDWICADNSDTSTGPNCSPPASAEALRQIAGAAIAKGEMVGTYRR